MTKSRQIVVFFAVLMILTGAAVFSYPFVSNALANRNASVAVQEYNASVSSLGREDIDAFLEAGKKPSGSYVLPTSSATKYDEALKRESLFRTIGTYVYSHKGPSKLLGKHTTDAAAWVPDGEAIPIYDGINDFTEFAMEDHKLAAIMRMDASFLQDNPHVFGDYFIKRMARCFGSRACYDAYRKRGQHHDE